jgi:hypothetical protein
MIAKGQQLNATPQQKEGVDLANYAKKELRLVLRRQTFQMQADAAREDGRDAAASEAQGKADAIKIGTGELALSAVLGKLFKIFSFSTLGFSGTATQTPEAQTQAFVTKAKELLGGMVITGKSGRHDNFNDVVLVIAGSSALGYSPHKSKDFGDKSDIDLGVVSPRLLAACKDVDATLLRGLKDRTGPDPLPEIVAVSRELSKLVPFVTQEGKRELRDLSIMVYGSRAAAQRQAGVELS